MRCAERCAYGIGFGAEKSMGGSQLRRHAMNVGKDSNSDAQGKNRVSREKYKVYEARAPNGEQDV